MLHFYRGAIKIFMEVGWFIFYKSFHFGCFFFNKITGGKTKADINNDHENMVSKKKRQSGRKNLLY